MILHRAIQANGSSEVLMAIYGLNPIEQELVLLH